ncbi:NAD(+) diphosphatase [Arthrobacter sp. Sa2BUA2]|uniref:NAD(+) diphosphatase n=1 Tax=Arthrobacter pullicola TaxID=2762224 RepID=A0ABR8YIU9_9MICC|nr:NAD(+) diphosphatase [Arthrobacter pullicola]MBD8044162.1 NAD(+) diphosphatase [Arthrobacter pullicola]
MTTPPRTAETPQLGALPLARGAVDRGSERRVAEDLFGTILDLPSTRVMYISGGKTLIRDTGSNTSELVLQRPGPGGFGSNPVYLGRTLEAGSAAIGADIVMVTVPEPETAPAVEGARWAGLREVATTLGALDAGLFVEACAVSNWHATHTHCPRCGAPTELEQGGWVRRCPEDGSQHFPRTDPAIIVAITDPQDRILLGSAAAWPGNRYSTLAGFVEPGESLEAAVIREVAEEANVVVRNPQYLGSQPWPFPCSLMLGFCAEADGTEPQADGIEMSDVRWFTRTELTDAVAAGELTIPSSISIARNLIDRWYGGPVPEPVPAGGK